MQSSPYHSKFKSMITEGNPFRDHPLEIGRIRRRFTWPLRKDNTRKSKNVNNFEACRAVGDSVRASQVQAMVEQLGLPHIPK